MSDRVKDWDLYLAGQKFNNRLNPNYYDTTDTNWAFFAGEQWRNLKDNKLPKPVFNIIKRVIQFFVASMTTSNIKIHFEPMLYADNLDMSQEVDAADIANSKISDLLEKFKISNRIRDALFDGAITGDYCAHFYWDPNQKPYGAQFGDIQGEICMELVDGTNVFFGNANSNKVEGQPYIIISGRAMVKDLQEEARQNQGEEQSITSDVNYGYEAGDNAKIEVEADEYGKAQYIIIYRKEKIQQPVLDEMGQPQIDELGQPMTQEVETITATKCVENAYIYKKRDTGLSRYPIAWGNWERVKNCYHGRALVTGILPNQIFINRMFAMVMYHLMMTAFPKAVYNKDYITQWNNEVGSAIGLSGLGPEVNIKNIAGYLEPGNMSNQIMQAIEYAMQYTKETLGISDAAMGNIDPKNTSAIIAVQKSSAIPLENPKANLYEWIEDIGRILFDFMGSYYGPRPIIQEVEDIDPMTGEPVQTKQAIQFDFSIFKDLWLNVKADVGEASYWSEIAAVQTLDNLLSNGFVDIVDYLERVPDEYIPRKQELIEKLQARMEAQAQMQAEQMMMEQQMMMQPPI